MGIAENVFYEGNENCDIAKRLRLVNQQYVEETIYLHLNGECHG